MNLTRVTEYDYQGCFIKLVNNRGAFWAEIKSGESWTYTAGPRSCPQEALGCGELEALKVKIKKLFHPALIFAMRGREVGQEFILAHNLDAIEYLKTEAIGENMTRFFGKDKKRYYDLMQDVRRRVSVQRELVLEDWMGHSIPIILECHPLQTLASLTPLAYSQFTVI